MESQQKDHQRYDQPADVFNPRMAIGMLFIRRFRRKLESYQSHHGGCGIRQVVARIRHNRDAVKDNPCKNLDTKQQDIGGNANNPGEFPIAFAHGVIFHVLIILDKKAYQ